MYDGRGMLSIDQCLPVFEFKRSVNLVDIRRESRFAGIIVLSSKKKGTGKTYRVPWSEFFLHLSVHVIGSFKSVVL